MSRNVSMDRSLDDKEAEDAFTSEGGYVAREPEARRPVPVFSTRARLMSEFSISFDGRHYRYESFRYDRLVDAIAHAQSISRGASFRSSRSAADS